MKNLILGLSVLLATTCVHAVEFTIGSGVGDTVFNELGATDVGQVFIFPRSYFDTYFQIDSVTFWAKAPPSTVEFKLGYVNGNTFYQGYSSSYTFGNGPNPGAFEEMRFDIPSLQFPAGFYVFAYFTGLPENASFKLNSWSTDAYTSELSYLDLYNAGDSWCSTYYQINGAWGHSDNDLGFLAQVTGNYTGTTQPIAGSHPSDGFQEGVALPGGFYSFPTPSEPPSPPFGQSVPDDGSSLVLLAMSLATLGAAHFRKVRLAPAPVSVDRLT